MLQCNAETTGHRCRLVVLLHGDKIIPAVWLHVAGDAVRKVPLDLPTPLLLPNSSLPQEWREGREGRNKAEVVTMEEIYKQFEKNVAEFEARPHPRTVMPVARTADAAGVADMRFGGVEILTYRDDVYWEAAREAAIQQDSHPALHAIFEILESIGWVSELGFDEELVPKVASLVVKRVAQSSLVEPDTDDASDTSTTVCTHAARAVRAVMRRDGARHRAAMACMLAPFGGGADPDVRKALEYVCTHACTHTCTHTRTHYRPPAHTHTRKHARQPRKRWRVQS